MNLTIKVYFVRGTTKTRK